MVLNRLISYTNKFFNEINYNNANGLVQRCNEKYLSFDTEFDYIGGK